MSGLEAATNRSPEHGFILPYVLLVIAILAIASTIAAQRLTRATAVISDMQIKMQSERVLQSAEAAATYAVLTGNPTENGYDLSPESPIKWEYGILSANGLKTLQPQEAEGLLSDFWPADGGLRRYSLPGRTGEQDPFASRRQTGASARNSGAMDAIVSLQDISGLVSLNNVNSRVFEPLFKYAGADPQQSRRLVETLRDYIDMDSNKRPVGAERNDYRRQNLPPPSNSPLRSFEELGALMHADETLNTLDMLKLKELATIESTAGFRNAFAAPSQKEFYTLNTQSLLESRRPGFENGLEYDIKRTSGKARIRIWARRSDGRFDKRVFEIERFLSGIGEPYRRRWVYDATVLNSDLEKNISAARARGEPLNLDGLKHVVHAASSAP